MEQTRSSLNRTLGVALFSLGLAATLLLPAFANDYIVGVGVSAFTFTAAAICLNLVYGYAGLLSFAQLAFWGIGGYCTALLVMDAGASFGTGLIAAAALNAALALVVGWPALRLQRDSFVIVTLSFALLTFLISRDWVDLTRGPLGLPGLPAPELFGIPFGSTTSMYYLAMGWTLCVMAVVYALVSSRIGRTLLAIKHNMPLALAQGISPTPYRLLAFSLGAALTGVAGGIHVFYLKVVDPSILDFYYIQAWLIMVIVGGAGSFWGVVIAGLVLSALPEMLRFSNDLRMVIFGVILVVVVLVLPQGVVGWLRERRIARLRENLR